MVMTKLQMSCKVLLTGASGMLGRAVYSQLTSDPDTWQVCGLALSRVSGDLVKVDLTQPDQMREIFQRFKPSVVVHCAAERRPDVVEKNEAATMAINVTATRLVCQLAASCGAFVVYISSDYVFDGTQPPYSEQDKPNPVNKYGRSKLEGEKVTLETSPENVVLRVPILYGAIESLDESAVTAVFLAVIKTGEKCEMSHVQQRFPTHTADVATVILSLVKARLKDASVSGIFHWSDRQQMTKYDMAITMATVFGLPTGHLVADTRPAVGGVTRPHNCQLSTPRLDALGIGRTSAFKEAIYTVIKPLHHP